jgi:hypothetical protein
VQQRGVGRWSMSEVLKVVHGCRWMKEFYEGEVGMPSAQI